MLRRLSLCWGACLLLPLALPVGGALQIGQNFTGSSYNRDSTSQPPDADGAVGPAHFVELINGRFSVYDKTTGKRVLTKTDESFWVNAGITISSTQTTTDPRVIYDTYSQRWFASMIDFNTIATRQSRNRFFIAASSDPDPTKAWHGVAFTADPVNGDFADFPTMGVDRDAVYLSGDMFLASGVRVGPSLISIPKAGLLSVPVIISSRTSFGILAFNTRGNILQPCMTTGNATTGETVLSVGSLGLDSVPHSTLVLSSISGASAPGASLSAPTTLTVPNYMGTNPARQPDGSQNLDAGDNRISACVRRVGDLIYAVHSTEVNGRIAVRWYKINAVARTVVQNGTISDGILDLFYPSVAANADGTVVIACNGSSSTVKTGCYAALGQVTGGQLTFGQLLLLKAGSASYQQPDETGMSRWGDYSATTLDPQDPTRFWTIQMYPTTASVWSTQITELITGVRLNVSYSGSQITLSWPSADSGYTLQFTPALTPSPTWSAIDQSPVAVRDQLTVTLPLEGNEGYYRLVSQ